MSTAQPPQPPLVAARWQSPQLWSNASLLVGATVALEAMAFVSILRIMLRIKTRFYAMLMAVLLFAFTDFVIDVVCTTIPDNLVLDIVWCFITWCGACGFTAHNYLRLCKFLTGKHRRLRLALGVLVATSILLYTLYVADIVYAHVTSNNLPIGPLGNLAVACNTWAIVDGVANFAVSLSFIRLLTIRGQEKSAMLVFECTIILALAIINVVVPTFDPLFFTFYFAEALRFCIYSQFLYILSNMLLRLSGWSTKLSTAADKSNRASKTIHAGTMSPGLHFRRSNLLNQPAWSNSAFVWGAAMTLETVAVFVACRLFFRIQNKYYFALIIVLACSYIDLLFSGIYGAAAPDPVRDMPWSILSWMGVCGFNMHNYVRLRNLMGERYGRLRMPFAVLSTFPIVLYTIYTVAVMYYYLTSLNLPIGIMGVYGDCLDIWGLVDGAVSTSISTFFVILLQPSGWKSYELCPGYHRMLLHIKFMLVCECVAICTVAVINLVCPSFDPIYMTFYLAEGLRYYVYTNFLDMLCSMILEARPAVEPTVMQALAHDNGRQGTKATL
ncbi:hypothetical protein RI367_002622 [Sorochytrium milnesiophthora]